MKKIVILGLHLGFGGVEQSIINQANMLCDKYDVELVSIYKVLDKPSFNVNKKVKITYLTNLKPNREEFINYLKNKRLIKTFKEGLKSINILFKKKQVMKNFIKNCHADIIISSRVEITELLSKYKNRNVITIAEEHRHHNNDEKYVSRLYNATKGIDYLVSVSKELTDFYKERFKHTKCVYIPNGLDYDLKEKNKLNNKNLISVGRLSYEKGFIDLIDVFKLITEKDPDFHLDIIGDGKERINIENKIKEYKLEDKITLHGFQKRDYINEIMQRASLYLMTSHEESFGTVLVEAASFGIPQIAFSSAQGAHEIIENEVSGYLIENRNKEEMAEKVIELMNDRKKLKSFGEKAFKVAEKFSYSEVKKEWLNFIGDLK